MKKTLTAVLAISLGGCYFEFNNPAENLPPGEVRGTAVRSLAAGTIEPLEGVRVELKGTNLLIVTPAEGSFRFTDLPTPEKKGEKNEFGIALRYASASGGRYDFQQILRFALGKGDGMDLGRVALYRTGGIEGTVRLSEEGPKAGATVIIKDTEFRTQTDGEGKFRFSNVAPDVEKEAAHTVVAVYPGYSVTTASARVPAGKTAAVEDIILEKATVERTGIVNGKAMLSDKNSGEGIEVTLFGENGEKYAPSGSEGGLATSGLYTILEVPEGIYSMKIFHPKYEQKDVANVIVLAGELSQGLGKARRAVGEEGNTVETVYLFPPQAGDCDRDGVADGEDPDDDNDGVEDAIEDAECACNPAGFLFAESSGTCVPATGDGENSTPVADPGPNRVVQAGETVSLDGSRSRDIDGDSLVYSWTLTRKPEGSAASLSSTDSAQTSFLADAEGEYFVRLIVSDGKAESIPATVFVQARPVTNPRPVASFTATAAHPDGLIEKNISRDGHFPAGFRADLDASGSTDPDGDSLSFLWEVLLEGERIEIENAGEMLASFDLAVSGRYTVTLAVTDSRGATGVDDLSFSAYENHPPVAEITFPADGQAFPPGTEVTAAGKATDEDVAAGIEDEIKAGDLSWTLDGSPAGTGETAGLGALPAGDHVLSLNATDAWLLEGEEAVVAFSVAAAGPVIVSITPESAGVGDVIVVAGENFKTAAAENAVFFSGADVEWVRVEVLGAAAGLIQVRVPFGAMPGGGLVRLVTQDGEASFPFITGEYGHSIKAEEFVLDGLSGVPGPRKAQVWHGTPYVFVAAGNRLAVADLRDPENPVEAGSVEQIADLTIEKMEVEGDRLVLCGRRGNGSGACLLYGILGGAADGFPELAGIELLHAFENAMDLTMEDATPLVLSSAGIEKRDAQNPDLSIVAVEAAGCSEIETAGNRLFCAGQDGGAGVLRAFELSSLDPADVDLPEAEEIFGLAAAGSQLFVSFRKSPGQGASNGVIHLDASVEDELVPEVLFHSPLRPVKASASGGIMQLLAETPYSEEEEAFFYLLEEGGGGEGAVSYSPKDAGGLRLQHGMEAAFASSGNIGVAILDGAMTVLGASSQAAPYLISAAPADVMEGDAMILLGVALGVEYIAGTAVSFAPALDAQPSASASPGSSLDEIVVTVPEGAVSGDVTVRVNGQTSAPISVVVTRECGEASPCPAGMDCGAAGRCEPRCGADADCPQNPPHSCLAGLCAERESGQCESEIICDPFGTCASGFKDSSASCDDGDPCTFGEHCEGGGPNCVGGTPYECAPKACELASACNGEGGCILTFKPFMDICRAAASSCDVPEFCSGDSPDCPPDGFAIEGTACGDPAETECDAADTCDGAGTCRTNFIEAGVQCLDLSPEDCSAAHCDGTGACNQDWSFEPNTKVCREAGGACDKEEKCTGGSGTCPADGFQPNTVVCRNPAGECDAEERCDGVSASCPADQFASPGTACGDPGSNECTSPDTCDGAGGCQPNDKPGGTACGDQGVVCRKNDACDGAGTCVDKGFEQVGTSCGPPEGECFLSRMCDGIGMCVSNFAGEGTPCTDLTPGDCGDAQCDGSGSCDQSRGFEPNTKVCRSTGGVCDVEEKCTGGSGTCPANGFQPNAVVCRDAVGECDLEEKCSGGGASCPANQYVAVGTACADTDPLDCRIAQCNGNGTCNQAQSLKTTGTACGDPLDTECNKSDTCDISGNCQSNVMTGGAPCGDQGIECRRNDMCDGLGNCTDMGFETPGTACGNPMDTECDKPDSCDGNGTCLLKYVAAGGQCTDEIPLDCADAQCDGNGTCRQDQGVEPNTYVCRPKAGECDAEENCTGVPSPCPADQSAVAGTPCTDTVPADCYDAQCNGTGACSQTQGFEAPDAPCGDQSNTECDKPDTCDGAGACQANYQSGSPCADTFPDDCFVSKCDPMGVCDQSGSTQAPDAPCGDHSGTECSAPDTCDAGGICQQNNATWGAPCADALPDDCFYPGCDGNGACSQNLVVKQDGTACGDPSFSECDNADTCDDMGACLANYQFEGYTCVDTIADDCWAAQCDGNGACNQSAYPATYGLHCDNYTISDQDDICDGEGFCAGTVCNPMFECARNYDEVCDSPDPTCGLLCWVESPASTGTNIGVPTVDIFGRIDISVMTPALGEYKAIVAEIGYGDTGVSPSSWTTWTAATYNQQAGTADEYRQKITPSAQGAFDYAYRFKLTGGEFWVYCDSTSAIGYDPADAGKLTVNP